MRLLFMTGASLLAIGLVAACSTVKTLPDEDGGGSGADDDGDDVGSTGVGTKASSGPTTTGGGGACPSAIGLSGAHLLTVSVKLNPQKAFVLGANINVTGGPGSFTASMVLQPLSATDQQTAVCAPLAIENLPVSSDGSFIWNLGQVSLCGEANPISMSELVTTLTLDGTFCTGTPLFGCGGVSGIVSIPLPDFDLTGSTFTLQKYGGTLPAPLINCEMAPAQY